MTPISVSLREWESTGLHDDALRGYRFATDEDRRLAHALTRSGVLEFQELHDRLHVAARSHVGRIAIGDLTVTVRPKLGPDELLSLFRYAYGLRDMKRYASVEYAMAGDLFQDLVIAQLHAEVRDLLERGTARAYVERRDDLASPRGRIDFARLAAQGGIVSAALPCRHHRRSSDHLLNQMLVAGLALARGLAQSRELSAAVGRQRRLLSQHVSHVALSSALLDRASRAVTRLVRPYASIIRLVEILYRSQWVDLAGRQQPNKLSGFLFDMNIFFQTLLGRYLAENLPGLEVETQHGLTEMMRYLPGHNPRGRRAPRPCPDYTVKQRGNVLALLDAKYRDLWKKALPPSMLYQLSVYALSQPRGSTAAILYPTSESTARQSIIEIREPMSGRAAGYVALRPVHLPDLVRLIEGRDRAVVAEREEHAGWLAGVRSRPMRFQPSRHHEWAG